MLFFRGWLSASHGLQYDPMAHSDSWRFRSVASLSAVAALLCLLGAFSIATWPEAPASLAVAGSTHVEQGSAGNPLAASYLAVSADEVENGDKSPLKAGLLTALLLAFFFVGTAGWSPASGYAQWVARSPGVAPLPSFVPRHNPPSLGVFRL